MCRELRIRRYRHEADADVRALSERTMADALGSSPEEALDRDMDAVREMRQGAEGTFLVGTVDGRPVSMGGFARLDATTAELRVIRVDPAHQRRGHGRALLDALEAAAEHRGVERLVLETHENLTAAQRFYEARGYRETGRTRDRGEELVRYEKRL